MSADNGVYILVTNRGRGKREYRVTHCQCIEDLTDTPDFPHYRPKVNLGEMTGFFGKSRVMTDRNIANGYAQALLDRQLENGGICEYGIVWLEFPDIRFPKIEHDESHYDDPSYQQEEQEAFSRYQDRFWASIGR